MFELEKEYQKSNCKVETITNIILVVTIIASLFIAGLVFLTNLK